MLESLGRYKSINDFASLAVIDVAKAVLFATTVRQRKLAL